MLLLQQGKWLDGWQEYEWRWQASGGPRQRPTALPAWQGESLDGRTLLVWGEQGVGDEIMFASCVPDAAMLAEHCIFECSPRLEKLFARSLPGVRVVAARADAKRTATDVDAQADVQIAAGSLPRFLRGSLTAFPRRERFLAADAERQQHWQARLAELGPGLKVGPPGEVEARDPTVGNARSTSSRCAV
ncbi:MAG: hypothetical protein R3C10_10570 [Pirellulales bacterium]